MSSAISSNSITFESVNIPLQHIDYFTVVVIDQKDISQLYRITLWGTKTHAGPKHYTRIALNCDNIEAIQKISQELLNKQIPDYTTPPKDYQDNPLNYNHGHGQGRWFEIYKDKIMREEFVNWERKEERCNPKELTDWLQGIIQTTNRIETDQIAPPRKKMI